MKNHGNSIIKVNALTKRLGSIAAVNQISFDVSTGEVFGLRANPNTH